MRKGYRAEYLAKKELIEKYGKDNVIKVAIGQFGADFLVFNNGNLTKIVEVKQTHKNKFYPSKRERDQLRRIKEFAKKQGCEFEVWVYKFKTRGKKHEKEVIKWY